ncbi:uncharacterized protein LOC118508902 [Anopheles stephensi]|uniref:uncharacterized protein LOC118508902 n=1 Tax=Anopheles stephensi TaxID=30069 RepID=UPI001658BCEC|nr:uncharacterized protein LOC118508902 [Anopheles stephensi]
MTCQAVPSVTGKIKYQEATNGRPQRKKQLSVSIKHRHEEGPGSWISGLRRDIFRQELSFTHGCGLWPGGGTGGEMRTRKINPGRGWEEISLPIRAVEVRP